MNFINFIKTHGINDGVTPIYHFSKGKTFKYDNKVYDVLFMGIYQTMCDQPQDVVSFLAIELDENGEDTTNEVFFDWEELTQNVQNKIIKEINIANKTNQKNKKQVFVVTEHYEWENDPSDTNVVGVYSTFKKAQQVMTDAYESEKESWLESVVDEEDDMDTNEFDSCCTIYNIINGIDYYKVEIYEKELED